MRPNSQVQSLENSGLPVRGEDISYLMRSVNRKLHLFYSAHALSSYGNIVAAINSGVTNIQFLRTDHVRNSNVNWGALFRSRDILPAQTLTSVEIISPPYDLAFCKRAMEIAALFDSNHHEEAKKYLNCLLSDFPHDTIVQGWVADLSR